MDGVLNTDETTEVQTLRNCAYTQQTTIKDIGRIQERFDPSAGRGLEWQLLQVNGQNPTDQQVHYYEPKPRQRHPAVLNFEFIDSDSFQLLEETQSKLQFEYKVVPSVANGLNQYVTHQLTVDSDTGQLLEMKSLAQKSFRIQRWAQIEVYENVSTFRFEKQINGTVLEQITLKLGVKSGRDKLYHEVTKQFSDFDCTQTPTSDESKDTGRGQLNDELDTPLPQE